MNLSARLLLLVAILGLGLGACTTLDVFERNVSFKNQQWPGSEKPSFSFHISDTTAQYNIYLVFRHTNAYSFNNIWLKLLRSGPDTSYTRQVDLRLATNDQGWLGTGMDDIWEHRIRITETPVGFRKAGDYRFDIEQVMRQDPLLHVINVGLRVEKVQ
ncbi:MAG: gliding motility lipoprotein GldH [Bacteroidetes bacterium]|nr:gliding motility lipoprotein GldH [Bacteroidota bacterium]